MKVLICAATALTLSMGMASAQSLNKDGGKHDSVGTTGAMGNASSNGVATDPQGVKEQQGRSTNASPGTVGASPGVTPPAQKK